MRILVMTDSFLLPTGLARVGREIAAGLLDGGHQVGYLGWFHRSELMPVIPHGLSYWFTNNNLYGSDVFDSVVMKFRPDVVLTIGDIWNISYMIDPSQCRTRRHFQWCAYISVDGEPVTGGLPPALVPVVEDVDIPVAYTHYAARAILKSVTDSETRLRLRVIYHGVDTNIFKPLPFVERKRLRIGYGIDDKFLVLCVCRNQSRKNIPEMFRAWKKFSEMPEANGRVIFWPHMHFRDPMGWRISDLLDVLRLRNQSVMYYNEVAYAPSEMSLVPDVEVAKLYQIADAFLLISGEGFGLPTFEAMASRVPCVLLNYAASSEIGADNRAELVPCGEECSWTGMHLTQRPIPCPDRIVDSLVRVYSDREYRDSLIEKGYEFATKYSWKTIRDEWNNLFLHLEVPFLKPLKLEVVS